MLALLLALQAPLPTPANTPRPAHDAEHYAVFIEIPDTGRQIRGEVMTRWRLRSADPIRVELDSALQVDQVLVGNGPVRRWRRQGDVLMFPSGRGAGETVTTLIRYSGQPRDGLIIRDSAGQRTVFADNWPNRARRWFPSQDHPSDKATVAFEVVAPGGYQVIANGRLVETVSMGPGRSRWKYRTEHPIPVYTMVIGMARFALATVGQAGCAVRCVPVSVWAYPPDSAFAVDGPFRRAPAMVDFFTGLIGEFPYSSLAHVQSSTIFGGMENSTAIFYAEGGYRSRRMGEGVVAHETAHQWFGDAVTEREWPHLWLSEGFATYFTGLWVRHADGDSAFRAYMERQAAGIRRSPATERPVLDSSANLMDLLNSNNYNKGGWVLHSLRGLLGDSTFVRGVREYYRRYRDSTVLSDDFRQVMEQAAGQDLAWYFRQALQQPGYPRLELRTRWDSAAGRLTLNIRQVQKAEWGVYRIPKLEVRVDGVPVRVNLEARDEDFTFTTFSTPPARVELDPDGWWLMEGSWIR